MDNGQASFENYPLSVIHYPLSVMKDLIIIGAGPAGISAAWEAQKLGLNYLVIEKKLIGTTIYKYPVGLTVFSTTNELELIEGTLKPAREKPTRDNFSRIMCGLCSKTTSMSKPGKKF